MERRERGRGRPRRRTRSVNHGSDSSAARGVSGRPPAPPELRSWRRRPGRASSWSPRILPIRSGMCLTSGSPRCRAGSVSPSRVSQAEAPDGRLFRGRSTWSSSMPTGALDRWIGERRVALKQIVGRGTYLDDDDIDSLLRLAFPGVDELIGLLELTRLAEVRAVSGGRRGHSADRAYTPVVGHACLAPTDRGHPRTDAGEASLPVREPRRTLPVGRQ